MSGKNAKHLLSALIVCNLALIWGNSLMTGTDSGNFSGAVLEWLSQFLPFMGTEAGHLFLRKAAHFSEFCLLGALTGARQLTEGKAPGLSLSGFGLAVACIDETIQIYVPGRGSSLIDVWIDTAGFVTGMILVKLGHSLIRNRNNYNH